MFPELPKNQQSFTLEIVGENTGHKYEGIFTVKCVLSILDKTRLELEKTRILADYANPTEQLRAIATVLSNVRARVVEAPDWWKQSEWGNKLLDENVIVAIYDKALEAEDKWKADLLPKPEVTPEGN